MLVGVSLDRRVKISLSWCRGTHGVLRFRSRPCLGRASGGPGDSHDIAVIAVCAFRKRERREFVTALGCFGIMLYKDDNFFDAFNIFF